MGGFTAAALLLLFAFYNCFNSISASIGDQSLFHRKCISNCSKTWLTCPTREAQFAWWACEECFRCRQNCIWDTVEHFRGRGQAIPQFHGKWPFVPVVFRLGSTFVAIQEPASVLFSLLNAFTMWRMMHRIRREIPTDWYCRDVWLQFAWVGLFTWFASTIFHCCDHWLTEMLDYCSAFALILFTMFASLRFVLPQWNLASIGRFGRLNHDIFRPIGLSFLYFYVHYLHSMYKTPHFDYGFHIRCCVQIGCANALLFLLWAFWEWQRGRARKSMLVLAATFGIGFFAAAFDALFDFAPIFWIIDAHALFHLFSAPVPLLWAEFLCREADQESQEKQRLLKERGKTQ